jgi:hypothetical protein
LSRELTVGLESEPRKILEQRSLEDRTASGAIVIFNAEQHSRVSTAGASRFPDIDGIENVAEVEVTGGGGSETRDDRRREIRDQGWGIGD